MKSYSEWLAQGFDNGWIGKPFCCMHGYPDELKEEEIDDDACIFAVRLYDESEPGKPPSLNDLWQEILSLKGLL